jgi:hypothetical protein
VVAEEVADAQAVQEVELLRFTVPDERVVREAAAQKKPKIPRRRRLVVVLRARGTGAEERERQADENRRDGPRV